MLINIWRVGVSRMGLNSFQWCPATGQGAMGTKWSTGSSVWRWGRTSSLWGWRSPGTGCPWRLWSLLLWRYSRPAWTRSCAACCRWPCFSRGVELDVPQRSLPTPTILWFCDSVILWLQRAHNALVDFSAEHDSSVTLAKLPALVERQLTYNMKEASANHESLKKFH